MTDLITLAGKLWLTALLMLIFWWGAAFISSLLGVSWAEAAVMSIVAWWLWTTGHGA